jgi:hypothetical protein
VDAGRVEDGGIDGTYDMQETYMGHMTVYAGRDRKRPQEGPFKAKGIFFRYQRDLFYFFIFFLKQREFSFDIKEMPLLYTRTHIALVVCVCVCARARVS